MINLSSSLAIIIIIVIVGVGVQQSLQQPPRGDAEFLLPGHYNEQKEKEEVDYDSSNDNENVLYGTGTGVSDGAVARAEAGAGGESGNHKQEQGDWEWVSVNNLNNSNGVDGGGGGDDRNSMKTINLSAANDNVHNLIDNNGTIDFQSSDSLTDEANATATTSNVDEQQNQDGESVAPFVKIPYNGGKVNVPNDTNLDKNVIDAIEQMNLKDGSQNNANGDGGGSENITKKVEEEPSLSSPSMIVGGGSENITKEVEEEPSSSSSSMIVGGGSSNQNAENTMLNFNGSSGGGDGTKITQQQQLKTEATETVTTPTTTTTDWISSSSSSSLSSIIMIDDNRVNLTNAINATINDTTTKHVYKFGGGHFGTGTENGTENDTDVADVLLFGGIRVKTTLAPSGGGAEQLHHQTTDNNTLTLFLIKWLMLGVVVLIPMLLLPLMFLFTRGSQSGGNSGGEQQQQQPQPQQSDHQHTIECIPIDPNGTLANVKQTIVLHPLAPNDVIPMPMQVNNNNVDDPVVVDVDVGDRSMLTPTAPDERMPLHFKRDPMGNLTYYFNLLPNETLTIGTDHHLYHPKSGLLFVNLSSSSSSSTGTPNGDQPHHHHQQQQPTPATTTPTTTNNITVYDGGNTNQHYQLTRCMAFDSESNRFYLPNFPLFPPMITTAADAATTPTPTIPWVDSNVLPLEFANHYDELRRRDVGDGGGRDCVDSNEQPQQQPQPSPQSTIQSSTISSVVDEQQQQPQKSQEPTPHPQEPTPQQEQEPMQQQEPPQQLPPLMPTTKTIRIPRNVSLDFSGLTKVDINQETPRSVISSVFELKDNNANNKSSNNNTPTIPV